MDAKELAKIITGNECRGEITKELEAEAKIAGLVVVFGAGDDLIEFRGAIDDEAGVPDAIRIDSNGLCPGWEDNLSIDDAREYFLREKAPIIIEANHSGDTGFKFDINCPHETFDIVDDGEPYCTGLIFELPRNLDWTKTLTPPGGDWKVVAKPGAITRSIVWDGKEVTLINPAGDYDDHTEGNVAMGMAAMPVACMAFREILALATGRFEGSSQHAMEKIAQIARAVTDHIQRAAPPIGED